MPVLVIKSPAVNKAQQQFLGYEWIGAKGQEGIRYFGGDSVKEIQTPLFDTNRRDNIDKLSYWVQRNFEGQPLVIPSTLQNYATPTRLVDLLEFGRVAFDKQISLVPKKRSEVTLQSKWPMKKIGDICSFEYGKSLPEVGRQTGPYPVMGSNGRVGWHSEYLVTGPAIIVGRKGSAGEVVWEEENCYPIDTTFYVATKDQDIDLFYFYLVLKGLNLSEARAGIGVPGLNRNDAYQYRIPLPPPKIQQQIVAECEAVDKAVEAARGEIAQAKQSVLAAFEQAAHVARREVRLSNADMFDIFIGKRVLKSEITDNDAGTPVYSANVFQPFGSTRNEFLDDFSTDSVLWGIDGDWMVNLIPAGQPFYPTDHCGVVRIKAGTDVHPHYFWMALEREGQRLRFSRSNRAKTEAIKGLKLLVPDEDTQANLAEIANQAEKKIAAAQIIITVAPSQKQAILQRYL